MDEHDAGAAEPATEPNTDPPPPPPPPPKPADRHGMVPLGWQVADDRLLVQGIKKRAIRRFLAAPPKTRAERAKEAQDDQPPREQRERMSFARFKEGMEGLGKLGSATHLRYGLDFKEIAEALRIDLAVCKKLLGNGRVFSQIGEEHAASKLGFKLHGHKDAGGSDGFREAKDRLHLVSVKGMSKSVCFQLSSLTGGSGGKYCDKEALLDCLDLTSEVVVVDARFEKVLMTQMPAETLKAWVHAGLLTGNGMRSEWFYSAVASTCHVEPLEGRFSCSEVDALLKNNEDLADELRLAREDPLPFEHLFEAELARHARRPRP